MAALKTTPSKLPTAASATTRPPVSAGAPETRSPNPRWVQLATQVPDLGAERQCIACEDEVHVQRKTRDPEGEPPAVDSASMAAFLRSDGGSPLEPRTRAFMEQRLGHDFGGVRIHTGAQASASAKDLDALAYTVGQHIVFADTSAAPQSIGGRKLLAHELVHTVQQRGRDSTAHPLRVSHPSDGPEQEAAQATTAALRGEAPVIASRPGLSVARQPSQSDEEAAGDEEAGEEQAGEKQGKLVDIWKGTPISQIVISLARGRIGFRTPQGMLMGKVGTDLDPGTYSVRRDPTGTELFAFITNVKDGMRFEVDLSESKADPWTLAYADPLELVVLEGMLDANLKTPVSELLTSDWLYLIEPEPGTLQPPGPVTGIDDYETITYIGNGEYVLNYRDGTSKTIAYADLTPKMLAQYKRIHDRINEEFLDFEIISFLVVWSIVEGLAIPFSAPPPRSARPPASKPPASKPPAAKPPAAKPPVSKPPVSKPPVSKPPASKPPASKPAPPKAQPPKEPAPAVPKGVTPKQAKIIDATRAAMKKRKVVADVGCGRCKLEAEKLQGKLQNEGIEASIGHVAKPGSGDHSFVQIGGPGSGVIGDTSLYQFFVLPKGIQAQPFVGTLSQLRAQVQSLLKGGATFQRAIVPRHINSADGFVKNYYIP